MCMAYEALILSIIVPCPWISSLPRLFQLVLRHLAVRMMAKTATVNENKANESKTVLTRATG